MNDQYQETLEPRKGIPEERKHDIMVLLARMIHQHLIASSTSKESTTRKGLESRIHLSQHSMFAECGAHAEMLGADRDHV